MHSRQLDIRSLTKPSGDVVVVCTHPTRPPPVNHPAATLSRVVCPDVAVGTSCCRLSRVVSLCETRVPAAAAGERDMGRRRGHTASRPRGQTACVVVLDPPLRAL